MSCNCNKAYSYTINNQSLQQCGCNINTGCGYNNFEKYIGGKCDCYRCRKHKEKYTQREHENPKKKCGKCHKKKCECVECVSCIKTKHGFIAASLTKSASPSYYTAAGQTITYSYTITNTGCVPICDPIRICDDHLGGQLIPRSFILPGGSQTFTRTYTTTDSDLLSSNITNKANAYIEVECKCWVITNQASATVTFGNADLFGSISQTFATGSTGNVEVTVTLSNSALSLTAAQNVSITLPFPANINTVIAGVPPPTSIGATSVSYTIGSLDIGASTSFRFQYTAGSVTTGSSYAFAGIITSSTYDPNLANNSLTNTFVFP